MNRWPGGWWIAPACFLSLFIWVCMARIAFGDITVRNDKGGSLQERLNQIATLRETNEPVRITGYCASACTMYLGLPNACVTRSARLAFHGPQTQFYGVGLTATDFEQWSRVIADQYPPRVRAAYLRDWRYTTVGTIEISGTEAIRMGVRECE